MLGLYIVFLVTIDPRRDIGPRTAIACYVGAWLADAAVWAWATAWLIGGRP